ncbi:WD40/YVTN/BNR-like repeat-containing protein [Fulvivirga lutea]|nr:hypothetical protein [Fulvivirga lutea]
MKYIITIALAFTMSLATGQKLDMEFMNDLKPRSIGPAGMSGRVTAIDAVHSNKDIIYAGTASGGLWKSVNGGINWDPVFDDEKVMSIGAVAIQQNNPNVVWAGTGEGNPRNSLNGGFGLYKSLDGGKSWKLMGLEKTRNIYRIKIDPLNPNTVYVGAIGSPWGEHPERGVYKTTDGGKTWDKILFVDNKTGCAELVMDPTNPNKLIASMWEHRRKPWTFSSGGPGSGLYMTVDGGENWKKLTKEDGIPDGDLGRIGLAISQSNPNRLYALIESKKNALYRSDDGGYKWTMVSDKTNEIGDRPFYYSEIYVDPINENRLYTVFTYVNVSEDGGKTFTQLMDAYNTTHGVHPDHHAFWIHPEDPEFIIEGNDGGLNISRDRGKSWRFVENLPIAQFYHINVDNDYPYNVYGGMQDNGSWIGPAYVWKSQGIRNAYWQELSFGDGFDVMPDPDDNRYGYSMWQEGSLLRYDRVTGHFRYMQPTHPDPKQKLRFNWNAALAQDPFNKSTIYYGSQFVHKSTDKGVTWEIISPDLTTNNPDKQKQYLSGGLTMDATGAENNTTILAISPSPVKEGIIWVGTDDGYVQVTRDGGKTWQNVTQNIPGMPKESWVAQVKPSTYNAGEAFIVVNNYRNFDFKPYLFRTTDYGATWKSMVNESEVWNYTLSFIQDPVEPNLMFLGSEGGLYVSINGGANWQKWTNDYPSVPTMDLVIHPREHDLVIGTYGRAAYVLDDIRPLRAIANKSSVLKNTLKVFEAPTAFQSISQEASGTRFVADAIFNGENRRQAAMLTYLINKPEKEKKETEETSKKKKGKTEESVEKTEKEEVKYDSVRIDIYNADNSLIRTLKFSAPEKNGIHRTYWYMNEKGIHSPSRTVPADNASEPGGVQVVPGTYKAVFNYGDKKDSTYVKVVFDPRKDVDNATLQALHDFNKKIESNYSIVAKATHRLAESKSILDDYLKRMKEKDEKGFKELIDKTKAAKDSIDQLFIPLIGEDNSTKQGIIATEFPTVDDRFQSAYFYLATTLHKPGATEERLLNQAIEMMKPEIEKVDSFFTTTWSSLKAELEKVDLSPFKEYEPLIK